MAYCVHDTRIYSGSLAKESLHIVTGKLLLRIAKHICGTTLFYDFAEVHKYRFVGYALCPLHVVSDNYNRVVFLERYN